MRALPYGSGFPFIRLHALGTGRYPFQSLTQGCSFVKDTRQFATTEHLINHKGGACGSEGDQESTI